MADTIGVDDIRRMIRSAAEKIRANRDELSKLDSAIGDGDHGTTIARAMGIAEKVIDAPDKKELKGRNSNLVLIGPVFFFLGLCSTEPYIF